MDLLGCWGSGLPSAPTCKVSKPCAVQITSDATVPPAPPTLAHSGASPCAIRATRPSHSAIFLKTRRPRKEIAAITSPAQFTPNNYSNLCRLPKRGGMSALPGLFHCQFGSACGYDPRFLHEEEQW